MDPRGFYEVANMLSRVEQKIGSGARISMWPKGEASGVIIQLYFPAEILFPGRSVRAIRELTGQEILSWRKDGITKILDAFADEVIGMINRDKGAMTPGKGWR